MSHSLDDTSDLAQQQAMLTDDWNQHIVATLPSDLQEHAQRLNAFRRARGLRNASDLLRGLLGCVLLSRSFRDAGMWSVRLGLADISDSAWRKHLRLAGPWLLWVLSQMIAFAQPLAPALPRQGVRRILLMDATHWKCPGAKGMVWRVHTAFDLLAGRLAQLKVSDHHQAEDLRLFDLQAGDVLVCDSANGIRDRFAFVVQCAAHLVARISPHAFPVLDEQGESFEIVAWLKSRRARAGHVCSRTAVIEHENARLRVRLVALRLSLHQQQKAQRKAKRKASKQQRKIKADTLYMAGWILVATTLPAEGWSETQVLRLYQARWHIELLFKRIKQLLDLHVMRWSSRASAQAAMTALLIGWALMEEQTADIQRVMLDVRQSLLLLLQGKPLSRNERQASWWDEQRYGEMSQWQVGVLGTQLLKTAIAGTISLARTRACMPRLQRFFRSSKRQRAQQRDQIVDWLTHDAILKPEPKREKKAKPKAATA